MQDHPDAIAYRQTADAFRATSISALRSGAATRRQRLDLPREVVNAADRRLATE
jgi:hypothetical protein